MGHRQPHKPCVIDNIRFASHTEGLRYIELRSLKKAGVITDFECQPKYVLQEAYRKCPACDEVQEHVPGSKKKMHTHCRKCGEKMDYWDAVEYFADFRVIYPDGSIGVEDVKYTTDKKRMDPTFNLKRRIFERQYPGIHIEIVVPQKPPKKAPAQKAMNEKRRI